MPGVGERPLHLLQGVIDDSLEIQPAALNLGRPSWRNAAKGSCERRAETCISAEMSSSPERSLILCLWPSKVLEILARPETSILSRCSMKDTPFARSAAWCAAGATEPRPGRCRELRREASLAVSR